MLIVYMVWDNIVLEHRFYNKICMGVSFDFPMWMIIIATLFDLTKFPEQLFWENGNSYHVDILWWLYKATCLALSHNEFSIQLRSILKILILLIM